jgi:hypothetical protein
MTPWPFFPRNPAPWTDYLASGLVVWWATMYVLSGIVRVLFPRTYEWADRRARQG